MRPKSNSLLVPVLVSPVVSAAVAVAGIEVIAPSLARAAPGAQTARASITLSAVDKLVAKDYNATNRKLGSLQSMIETNTSQLRTLITSVASLQDAVSAARTSASQAQTVAGQANGQLTTLMPIVKGTAERLYDTCVLTSSLWQRSFPGIDANVSGTTWTADLGNEAGGNSTAGINGLDRCYSASASQNGLFSGGMLPAFAQPDDAYTATPPAP
jgi:hypothetical protein